jgi:hypothetical protein
METSRCGVFRGGWFDYEIQEQVPGGEDLLLPNAPTHAFTQYGW